MELEIKHLAPYLVHNLMVQTEKIKEPLKMVSLMQMQNRVQVFYDDLEGENILGFKLNHIKPIMYQLNLGNLTKEIKHNGENVIPIYYIFNPNYKKYNHKIEIERPTFSSPSIIVHIWANDTCYYPHKLDLGNILYQCLPFYVFQNLCALHFDFQDLVSNGLAYEKSIIDNNTLSVE